MTTLKYPYADAAPLNKLHQVAHNVFWLRVAMPFSLDHINLWLIEDDSYWTVIDTGPDTKECRQAWQSVIATQLHNKPIKSVLCTHFHPDHLGLAGWLCEENNCDLSISKGEYDIYQQLFSEQALTNIDAEQQQQVADFYQAIGASEKQAASYDKHMAMFAKIIHPLPNSYQRISEGETLTIGEHQWLLTVGVGHSPEHICLYCKELDVLISGDQLLPTISSNVSVWPNEPNANPMQAMLNSYHKLSEVISNNTLVLPAHGLPFYNGVKRLQQLIDDTEVDLEKLYLHCVTPKKVNETFTVLFRKEVGKHNIMLAYGEALACLNYLITKQRVAFNVIDGVNHYQQS